MKKYKEILIYEHVEENLDVQWPFYENTIISDTEDDDRNEVDCLDSVYGECPSISINKLYDILNKLKNLGADRVYIGEHPDHYGYYFTGVKLEEIKENA